MPPGDLIDDGSLDYTPAPMEELSMDNLDPQMMELLNPLLARRKALATAYATQADKYNQLTDAAEKAQAGGGLSSGQGIASVLVGLLPTLVAGAFGGKRAAGQAAASGVQGIGTYQALARESQKADLQRLLGLSKQQQQLLSQTANQATGVDKAITSTIANRTTAEERNDRAKEGLALRETLGKLGLQQSQNAQDMMNYFRQQNLDQRKLEEDRKTDQEDRLQSREANQVITETLAPVENLGGALIKNKSGAIPKLSKNDIDEIQKTKDASDRASELSAILKPQYTKEGLTINLATEDGRVVYNKMRSDLQALFEEVAANSVYSKQGLRPDEIGRLLRRMPADPDEFTSLFRNPAITFTKAEIASLDKLTEQLNRVTRTTAKNRGVVFPNPDGTFDEEIITPDDVFSFYKGSYQNKKLPTASKNSSEDKVAKEAKAENDATLNAAMADTKFQTKRGLLSYDELTDKEKEALQGRL